MALDAGALEDAIFAFLGEVRAAAEVADDLAAVYDTYAQGAQFGGSVPTLTGRRDIFAAALVPVTNIGAAVAAYWGPTPSPVPVVGPQTGTVVGCPGAAGIAAALAPLLLTSNTRAVAAAALADALHTATLTVTANVAPPPGTILPIT